MAGGTVARFGRPDLSSEAFGQRRIFRARAAIAAIFFQQGLLVGGWALQIPVIIDRLQIDKATMGLVIVVFGLGSVATMLSIGPHLGRKGSRGATRLFSLLAAFALVALASTPNLWTTFVVAAFVGSAIGAVDVSMNAQAVEIERRARHAIMSSFHAFWSMGTLVGALVSGWLIVTLGAFGHAVAFTIAAFALWLVAYPHMVRERRSADDAKVRFMLPRAPVVWLLGLVALFAFVVEGAAVDWSALFLREEVGAPFAIAGWALAALQVTMMLARFGGDVVRDRIGGVRTLRWGGILAAFGFAVAAMGGTEFVSDWPVEARTALVLAGFLVTGLGLANLVPVAFAASVGIPGVPPSIALSIISVFGYFGILVFPSILGWIAEHSSFTVVFMVVAALPLAVSMLASAARRST